MEANIQPFRNAIRKTFGNESDADKVWGASEERMKSIAQVRMGNKVQPPLPFSPTKVWCGKTAWNGTKDPNVKGRSLVPMKVQVVKFDPETATTTFHPAGTECVFSTPVEKIQQALSFSDASKVCLRPHFAFDFTNLSAGSGLWCDANNETAETKRADFPTLPLNKYTGE